MGINKFDASTNEFSFALNGNTLYKLAHAFPVGAYEISWTPTTATLNLDFLNASSGIISTVTSAAGTFIYNLGTAAASISTYIAVGTTNLSLTFKYLGAALTTTNGVLYTYTTNQNVPLVGPAYCILIGGGGGGAGGTTGWGGNGGASGGIAYGKLTLTGTSALVIGGAGTAGTAPGGAGGTGGTSTFLTLTAVGGTGGTTTAVTTTPAVAAGGTGGYGAYPGWPASAQEGGSTNFYTSTYLPVYTNLLAGNIGGGGGGGSYVSIYTTVYPPGIGGGTVIGVGGTGGVVTTGSAAAGSPGTGRGAGGGGGGGTNSFTAAGGAGTAGVLYVVQ